MSCTNLIDLNDDCLLCIVSFLELRELVNFEHVCRRTQQIARMRYRKYSKYKLLLRDENMESAKILNSIGEFIEIMEFSSGFMINNNINKRILKNIANFCINMHTLTLSLNNAERVQQLEHITICSALKTLYLVNCDVNMDLIEGFQELKHITIIYE
ncbi:uncharacterized protein LOC129802224 isoform X2 [Phlebotomus papatasi]|uniref:uncharacterized protein LOC129802224 isoform X2 n=1 Tax=Phlebotomus papatasi TaxID=29031 RepID=UPI0024844F00|nr:uncharacterized protein LOC129802224 isoform X2 [Phlebotomus papatasi]